MAPSGERSGPCSGSMSQAWPAPSATWMRQTFSRWWCRLSDSLSSASAAPLQEPRAVATSSEVRSQGDELKRSLASLGLVPQRVHLRQGGVGRPAPVLAQAVLHVAEAAAELAVGRLQRRLGVEAQHARHVDGREQDVADLLLRR